MLYFLYAMQRYQSHVTQLAFFGVFNKDFQDSNPSLPLCLTKKKKKKAM